MTPILFIIMACVSLILWQTGFSICLDICKQIDVGYLNRSWFLWGAIFYSLAGIATGWVKKNLIIIMVLVNAVIFHAYLILNAYRNIEILCPVCIAFLTAEIVLTALYTFDKGMKFDKVVALGPGKAVLIISATLFVLYPAGPVVLGDTKPVAEENEPKTEMVAYYEESGMQTVSNQTYQTESTPEETETTDLIEERADYNYILNVGNSHGVETKIDLSQKPALMFAWWCGHCDQVLKDYSGLRPDDRPYLVAVYPKGINDRQYVEQKLKANGLNGEYYICYESPPVESIPMLVWFSEGKIQKTTPTFGDKTLLGKARIEVGYTNSGHNARLSAKAIDNIILLPREVFSFNKTVGERTVTRGFRESLVIMNYGDGPEYSEGIGGGICMTSTVLNWAVENAGLEVIEQHPHSLPVSYGKVREDTAVAWPNYDYSFLNNTGKKVTLKTKNIGEWLEIEIWNN
ncbi:MAG: hypothetical protein FH756_10780 [Firmicutes bacterium]|nr:hypothetical protein [Bacillota bacterium]